VPFVSRHCPSRSGVLGRASRDVRDKPGDHGSVVSDDRDHAETWRSFNELRAANIRRSLGFPGAALVLCVANVVVIGPHDDWATGLTSGLGAMMAFWLISLLLLLRHIRRNWAQPAAFWRQSSQSPGAPTETGCGRSHSAPPRSGRERPIPSGLTRLPTTVARSPRKATGSPGRRCPMR
jgi:hypothetical protein